MKKYSFLFIFCGATLLFNACSDENKSSNPAPANVSAKAESESEKDAKGLDAQQIIAQPSDGQPLNPAINVPPPIVEPIPMPPAFPGVFVAGGGGAPGRRKRIRPTETDFGDAPTSYGSASHTLNLPSTLRLGTLVDGEATQQFSSDALGDDNLALDDEDAVGTIVVENETPTTVSVTVFNNSGADATLVGWIDFDQSATFDNPTERVVLAVPSTGADATVDLIFPSQAISESVEAFARFRLFPGGLSENPDPSPIGLASSGEVEDHSVNLVASIDFGDAPEAFFGGAPAYNTSRARNGARHAVIDFDLLTNTSSLMIGEFIDVEADGVSSLAANHDDANGTKPDDEEGITSSLVFPPNTPVTFTVNTTNNTGGSAYLVAWLDLNRNGVFENTSAERQIIPSVAPAFTPNMFNFAATPSSEEMVTRIRLFPGEAPTPSATEPSPDGFVFGGEVEDYPVSVPD